MGEVRSLRISFVLEEFIMGKNCVICGKPSGMYPLCREHLQMKADGKVVKCEDCGIWHLVDSPCDCAKIKPVEENTIETECIICREPSNGYWFCRSCYRKYKERSIDLRITNCSEVEILDEYGNLQYKCDDGRKVRSRAEVIISNFLFKERVRAIYEKAVYYKNDNGENETLHPDFYLPDYDIYIEYNELTATSYLKSKDYTKKIYQKLGLKVLVITDNELRDIEAYLKPELGLH